MTELSTLTVTYIPLKRVVICSCFIIALDLSALCTVKKLLQQCCSSNDVEEYSVTGIGTHLTGLTFESFCRRRNSHIIITPPVNLYLHQQTNKSLPTEKENIIEDIFMTNRQLSNFPEARVNQENVLCTP